MGADRRPGTPQHRPAGVGSWSHDRERHRAPGRMVAGHNAMAVAPAGARSAVCPAPCSSAGMLLVPAGSGALPRQPPLTLSPSEMPWPLSVMVPAAATLALLHARMHACMHGDCCATHHVQNDATLRLASCLQLQAMHAGPVAENQSSPF